MAKAKGSKAKIKVIAEYRDIAGVQVPTNLPRPSKGRNLTDEQKIEISKYVCEVYAKDQHTIKSVLEEFGIKSEATFFNWQNQIEEIKEIYKEAGEQKNKIYFSRLKERARTALEDRVTGKTIILKSFKQRKLTAKEAEFYEVDMNESDIVEQTVKEVFIQPSDTAIIFALTNKDGKNFQRTPDGSGDTDDFDIPLIEWVEGNAPPNIDETPTPDNE